MSVPEVIQTIELQEGDSCFSEVRLDDEDGQPVAAATLTSLTLSLYGPGGDIINNRDEVDVKNTNGGTLDPTSGEFRMDFTSDDSPILDATLAPGDQEVHRALFVAKWGTGKQKSWIVNIAVRQVSRLP